MPLKLIGELPDSYTVELLNYAMQTIATLRIKLGDDPERTYPLEDNCTSRIGRDLGNDIVLDDPAVSRLHATISTSTAGVVIADNKSTNGTFVNGKRVSMRHLQLGDIVDIGGAKLSVDIHTERALRSLSSSSRSRALTAQLKPVAVTILLATLLTNGENEEAAAPRENVLKFWRDQVSDIVWTFSGVVDREFGNHLVALWLGRDAATMAHHGVKAAQKIREMTAALAKRASASHLVAKQILTSGHGLTGVFSGTQLPDGTKFTILGDQLNSTFILEDGVVDLSKDVLICSATAELVKAHFRLEASAIEDPLSPGKLEMYTVRPI
ncbi:MAG: FHA domain-containing protein [Deltaproteobacteria bacterium]|nr:FHA domain-containing protein [Deltaproteobacteria bacterium]